MKKNINKIGRFVSKKNVVIMSAYFLGVLTVPLIAVFPPFGTQTPPENVPTDLRQAVMNIINFILGISSMIAVLMIIYSGVLFMVSGGNEDALDRARRTMANAIIGIFIIGLGYAIVNVVIMVISA